MIPKPNVPAWDSLTASQLTNFIDRHCLQITKGGYRWGGSWEVAVPAPQGHYLEEAERTVAHGKTAADALQRTYEKLTSPKPQSAAATSRPD